MLKSKKSGNARGGGHDDNMGAGGFNEIAWGAVSRTPQCAHAITRRSIQVLDFQGPFRRGYHGHVVGGESSLHSTRNVFNILGLSP